MAVEQLDQLGKVSKRTREPVDLVHHHGVDLAGVDVAQELLHGRRSREAPDQDEPPALWHLVLDVGLAGLALGVERVEREVEVMQGNDARRLSQRHWSRSEGVSLSTVIPSR